MIKIGRRNAVFSCVFGQKTCDLGEFSVFSVFFVLSVMAQAIDNHSTIAKYSKKYSSPLFGGDCYTFYLCTALLLFMSTDFKDLWDFSYVSVRRVRVNG